MLKYTLLTALIAAGGKVAAGGIAVARRSLRQGSMIRDIKDARVEPITLIDSNVASYERMDDALHFSLNVFSTAYLQSIALAGRGVGNVSVRERLKAVSPTGGFSLESSFNTEPEELPNDPVVGAIINDDEALYAKGLPSIDDFASLESDRSPGTNVKAATEALRDVNALSVGKVLNVDIREGKETFTIPIVIRLATIRAENEALTKAMMNRFSGNESALERRVKWGQGRLRLISDVLLGADVRRKNIRDLILDEGGIAAKLNPNKASSYAHAAMTGSSSVAGASNIMILDSNTAHRVESMLGGNFDNATFRQRMLVNTGIMLLLIVDREADMVTIYLDTIPDGTDVAGRNLSKTAKSDGPDINALMAAMVGGSPQRALRFN